MSNKFVSLAKTALCAVFLFTIAQPVFSQAKKPAAKKPAAVGPKVTQIDIEGLKALIKPKGKPLLINFWATWCDPCREEFPDLVKINEQYKGKIDFVTVSLDDLADIKTFVPKFLTEVKAEMPAYLLKTADETAAITMVAKDWSGNLPLTILIAPSGETAYIRMGKIKMETVTAEVEKVLAAPAPALSSKHQVIELPPGQAIQTSLTLRTIIQLPLPVKYVLRMATD
ncbi:MAG: TlpA disulfide reductase family protein [Pyrinomonadaceae bacterium]